MAWIELHQSVWTHKKTIMLAAILDIDELYAAAHMTKLWTWALDNAQDGDLSGLPNRVIAFGAGWKGDTDQFVEAAKQAGWIDENGRIHDWFDYAGRLIEKKSANKERMRNARAKNVQRTNKARAGATKPNHTKPKDNPPLPPQGEYPAEFEEFWDAYPRKAEKHAAFTSWKSALKQDNADTITRCAENYAAECKRDGTDAKFIKHPTTFLNKQRYRDYLERAKPQEPEYDYSKAFQHGPDDIPLEGYG